MFALHQKYQVFFTLDFVNSTYRRPHNNVLQRTTTTRTATKDTQTDNKPNQQQKQPSFFSSKIHLYSIHTQIQTFPKKKKTRKYDSSFLRFHTSLILLFTLSYNSLSYGLLVVPPLYPVFSFFPTITLSSYSREKKLFSFHNATCPNTHNTYIHLSV